MKKVLLILVMIAFAASAAFAQTSYKSSIGKEDIKSWDGITSTFDRRTSTGGIITMTKTDYEVDVAKIYGSGVKTATTLNTAISQVGSTNKMILILSPGAWTIDVDVTVPSNIALKIPAGALLTVSAAKALTINGPFEAAPYKVFSGSGTVTFGDGYVKEAYPQWWGFSESETAVNNASYLTKALASHDNILIPKGSYNVDQINITTRGKTISGTGVYSTELIKSASDTSNNILLNVTPDATPYDFTLRDIRITGQSAADSNTGVYIKGGKTGSLRNVYFTKLQTCLSLEATINMTFDTLMYSVYTNGLIGTDYVNDCKFSNMLFFDGNSTYSAIALNTTNFGMCHFDSIVTEGTGIQQNILAGNTCTYTNLRVESIGYNRDTDWVLLSGNDNIFNNLMLTCEWTAAKPIPYAYDDKNYLIKITGNRNTINGLPIEIGQGELYVSGANNYIRLFMSNATFNSASLASSFVDTITDVGNKNTITFNDEDLIYGNGITSSKARTTNFLTQSLDLSGMTVDGLTVAEETTTANQGVLYTGNVYKVTTPVGNKKMYQQISSPTNGYYYIFSVWIQCVSGNEEVDVILGKDVTSATSFASYSIPANKLIRIFQIIKYETAMSALYVGIRLGTSSSGVWITSPQVAESNNVGGVHYISPGAYVPTAAAIRSVNAPNHHERRYDKTTPGNGVYGLGDTVTNIAPASGQPSAWTCTTAGDTSANYVFKPLANLP